MTDSWRDDAACKGSDANLFHPGRGDIQTLFAAVRVCNGCPVREECLEYAIVEGETVGVWGGKSERQRKRMRTARNREKREGRESGGGSRAS